MDSSINHHVELIIEQVVNLLDSNLRPLNEPQRHMIELIGLYTHDLYDAFTQAEQMTMSNTYLRSDIIDTLTTIAGYADMLADGWIGQFAQSQLDTIETLRHHVRCLIVIVRAYADDGLQAAIIG